MVRESRRNRREFGVSPVGVPAGVAGLRAEVLAAAPAVLADPGRSQAIPTRSPRSNSPPAAAPTAEPTSMTSPTTSWPGITRSRCTGRSPSVTWRSVRHTPHACTATSNSDGAGRGTRVVTRSSGPVSIGPGRRTCHALIVAVVAGETITPSCRYPSPAAAVTLNLHGRQQFGARSCAPCRRSTAGRQPRPGRRRR